MMDEQAIQNFWQDHGCGMIRRAALLAAFPLAKAGILKSDDGHGMLAESEQPRPVARVQERG